MVSASPGMRSSWGPGYRSEVRTKASLLLLCLPRMKQESGRWWDVEVIKPKQDGHEGTVMDSGKL